MSELLSSILWKSNFQKYLIAAIQHSFLAAFFDDPIKYKLIAIK